MKKVLGKLLRYFLIFFLGIFITFNAFVLLSGRLYMYKGIVNTYLVGKMGPTIYDLEVFDNSTLTPANNVEFVVHANANTAKISNDDLDFIKENKGRAFLVMQNDTIIYEQYWDRHNQQEVSNSFSVAKTVVSMLIGIAVEDGDIKSLDDPVANYLPEFEGEKEKVTIRHLLMMASGLDWTESGADPLSDNAESYYGWDLYGQTTSQELIDEPGKVFRYQSGNSQLLAFVLEAATGKEFGEYADEKIWKRIGTTSNAYWSLDREGGDEKAFCCMYSTARDFARLGQLFLNEGKFNGEQVVPAWYIKEMAQPCDMVTENGLENRQYGLHVWTYFGAGSPAVYFRGVAGQYIIAIPDEDMVIVRIGEKRTEKYEIPDDKLKDKHFVLENNDESGHCLGLFRYIAIAKKIKSETEL